MLWPQRIIVLICCQNVLKNHEKLKRYIHTKVIHPFSSPQFPSYHERSSDPLTRFAWNNSQDKEMRDLLTSGITMTDLKISQAEAHWSCCSTNPCRKSCIHPAFIDLNLWIIYDSEWAIRPITLPRLGQQFENLFVLHCKRQTRPFTHVRFESHFPFILNRVEYKYEFN